MTRLASILIISIAALGACDDNDDDEDIIIPDDDDDIPDDLPPSMLVWNANIVGTDIYSALTGQATVMQGVDAQAFTSMIVLRNDAPGAVRPWHVHFGTCGSGGGIVGPDAAYPRLTIGSDGTATATARIEAALDPAADYHVNVHLADGPQFGVLIACGDLVLE